MNPLGDTAESSELNIFVLWIKDLRFSYLKCGDLKAIKSWASLVHKKVEITEHNQEMGPSK